MSLCNMRCSHLCNRRSIRPTMRTMQYACAQRCAFVSCSTKSSNHSGRKIPSEQLRMKLNNSPNTKRSRGRCAFRVRLSSPASSDCPEAVSPSYAAMASATSVADQAHRTCCLCCAKMAPDHGEDRSVFLHRPCAQCSPWLAEILP